MCTGCNTMCLQRFTFFFFFQPANPIFFGQLRICIKHRYNETTTHTIQVMNNPTSAPESNSPTSLPPIISNSSFVFPLLSNSSQSSKIEQQTSIELDDFDYASNQLQQNIHLLDGVPLESGPGSLAATSSSFIEGWGRGVDSYVRNNETTQQQQNNLTLLPGGRTSPIIPPGGKWHTKKVHFTSPPHLPRHADTPDTPFTDTFHGRRVKPIVRPGETQRKNLTNATGMNSPTLELIKVKKKRAFLNQHGVLQFHEEEILTVEEAAIPPRVPGFWTTSSWCKEIMTRQELKLVLPKSCSDFDEVPMMPCMSNKYVRNLKPIMRDRNKNWRQTSFRNVYVGRGTLARSKKKKKKKKDFGGTDVVKWVEGYPLRTKILHTEACLISDEYTVCSIHGVGITGRIYNEAANPDIPRGLEVTAHTPEDCGK